MKAANVLLALIVAAACAESPTSPVPAAPETEPLFEVTESQESNEQSTCTIPVLPASGTTKQYTDVTYNVVSGVTLKLDLAVPRSPASPRPLVVFIHGGGWDSGSKNGLRTNVLKLTTLGYAAATIDYRLAPKFVFPAQMHDVTCAIDFLRANAKLYNIDPSRVVVAGHSAGAELAGTYGVAGGAGALHGPCSVPRQRTDVRGVVAFSSPTDFKASGDFSSGANSKIKAYLGGTPAQKHWESIMASPLYHVFKSTPSFFLVHGTQDPTISVRQSRTMSQRLTNRGIPHTLLELPLKHDILFLEAGQFQPATCGMLDFLNTTLSP